MKRFKLILGVLLIFVTGAAAGHLGTVYLFKNRMFNQGPPGIQHIFRQRIANELRLTDRQQTAFNRIMSLTENDFNAFRKKHRPEVEKIFTRCFGQIQEILRPDQQKKFEKMRNHFVRKLSGQDSRTPRHHRPGDCPQVPLTPPDN
ncbi:MAG: hypothetical protein R2875_05700 [Desulfobacterales bacterium]